MAILQKRVTRTVVMASAVVWCLGAAAATAQESPAAATYAEIEQTLGAVPSFFRAFPEEGIAGAWAEMKSIQMNPESALDPKTKELMGLAVASQIPCHYCIYFHTVAARANGATEDEIKEAVAMAAIVRHWSTVLNGMQVDFAAFRQEVDSMMAGTAEGAGAEPTP